MKRRDPSEGRAVLGFVGSDRFPRIVVKMERGRLPTLYWTGTGWTENASKALLYTNPTLAADDAWKFRPEVSWMWLGCYLGNG